MADTVSKEKRSEIMSHAQERKQNRKRSSENICLAQGLRYRKNVKTVAGNSGYRSSKVQSCNIREWLFFGMDIKDVNMLIYHLRIWNIGRRRLRII